MFKKYSVLHTAKFLFTKLHQFSPSDVVNFFRSCNIYEKLTNENCFLSENITYPHNQGLLYRPDAYPLEYNNDHHTKVKALQHNLVFRNT